MRKSLALAVASGLAGVAFSGTSSHAAVFQAVTGATNSWVTPANWNAAVPNAVGDNATFNGAATGSNPAQTGSRTATLDGTKTVGSILFNTDLSNFSNTIAVGTGGPLVFDETGSGPAVITTQGSGTGNNTISVGMTLNDDVTANVNNTVASSAAGSLNLTGTMGGTGGFTKNGDGLVTFGSGAKTYAGATIINAGRLRASSAARPQGAAGTTVNAGGQLTLISDTGTYTFGTGNLTLNGAGPTSGPFAIFPGAIRNDTGIAVTIVNNTVLQSDTTLHIQANLGTSLAPVGAMTFSGVVSGPGKLTLTGAGGSADQGTLFLTNTNTYGGGTLVAGGIVSVTLPGSTLGTGDVEVNDATATAAFARLSIAAGVLNAIADSASLKLLGGGAAATADENYAILGTGVNETVNALYLGGVQVPAGTYGSSTSPATNKLNEYFSGDGIITVTVPEPATLSLLALGGITAMRRRRAR